MRGRKPAFRLIALSTLLSRKNVFLFIIFWKIHLFFIKCLNHVFTWLQTKIYYVLALIRAHGNFNLLGKIKIAVINLKLL